MPTVRRLNALAFNGAPDSDGTRWGCEDLQGWWDGPEVRGDNLPAGTRHGIIYTRRTYGPREMLLRGWAVPGPGVQMDVIADRLALNTNAIDTGVTLYVDESVPKFTTVRRDGSVRSRLIDGQERLLEFEVPLIAADPRKYSQTLKTETITIADLDNDHSGTLTNNGTVSAFPERIFLEGGGSGPLKLGLTSEYISVFGGMTTGQRYVIYPSTAVVLFGTSGSEVSSYQNVYDTTRWWQFGVGATTVFWQRVGTTGGALTATIEYRDAWI